MSEYQYVAFRAIDGPVSKKHLAYMRRQSTRAEITPWSFTNEYHYGDFHGNAIEMMRRGYDIHLHYANFGTRSVYFRLPQGLPDPKAAAPYLDGESIHFVKDPDGNGGTLAIEPCYEPDDFEDLWDVERVLKRFIPLRSEILEGDLRPLYLAHLAVSCDSNHDPEESVEAPVPAGLDQPTKPQRALAKLYGIGDAIIAVAAHDVGQPRTESKKCADFVTWLSEKDQAAKDAWLAELVHEPTSGLRSELLAMFRQDQPTTSWPTVQLDRTMAELHAAAKEVRRAMKAQAAEIAARKRAKKLAEMAADPAPHLQKTERLVAQRTTDAYQQVGQLLADLREALVETSQSELADQQAWKLKQMHPTLRHLTAAIRRQGFVPK